MDCLVNVKSSIWSMTIPVLALLLLGVACGAAAPADDPAAADPAMGEPTPVAQPAPADEPAPARIVGRVIFALDPAARTAETSIMWHGAGTQQLGPNMQMLVGNDPVTGEYTTDSLAESWSISDDFTKWTFNLKRGVPFHFGWGEMTAHDVAYSHSLHIVEGAILSQVNQLREATPVVVDDYTVTFDLQRPHSDFAFIHAGRGEMFIYSQEQHEAEGDEGLERQVAGTGHYQFLDRRRGEAIVFERLEDHYSGEVPDFQELELRFVGEAATKLAMILAGEAHLSNLPSELHPQALDRGKIIIRSRNPARQVVWIFNGMYNQTGDPAYNPDLPWQDIRIRQALNVAINREELIQVIYGTGEILYRYGMDPSTTVPLGVSLGEPLRILANFSDSQHWLASHKTHPPNKRETVVLGPHLTDRWEVSGPWPPAAGLVETTPVEAATVNRNEATPTDPITRCQRRSRFIQSK